MFRWNETVVGTTVTTSCFYGPPEVRVERVCVSRQNLTAPSIESCRTFISAQYTILNNVMGITSLRTNCVIYSSKKIKGDNFRVCG